MELLLESGRLIRERKEEVMIRRTSRRLLYLSLLLPLLAASFFQQTPRTAYAASPCPTTTLANYLLLPSCEINGKTLLNFDFASSGTPSSNAIPASNLLVTPITTLGGEGL